jgi:hypothetical protein
MKIKGIKTNKNKMEQQNETICDIMRDWEEKTKKEAIKEIKEIIKKREEKEDCVENMDLNLLKDELLKINDELLNRKISQEELFEFIKTGRRLR